MDIVERLSRSFIQDHAVVSLKRAVNVYKKKLSRAQDDHRQ